MLYNRYNASVTEGLLDETTARERHVGRNSDKKKKEKRTADNGLDNQLQFLSNCCTLNDVPL